MKKSIMCMLVISAICADARTINVADHGIIPGKDVSLEVNKLIADIGSESDVTLLFPKGQYEFYPENAVEKYRAVANHDNSLKRLAFPLFNCSNITIDGSGSTFMFHGRISPFVVESTQGATLKNFSVDWARSFHDELTVVEHGKKGNSFTVEFDPDHYNCRAKDGEFISTHYNWDDPFGYNFMFDPKTEAPLYNTSRYTLNWNAKAKAAGKNQLELSGKCKELPPIGSVMVTYGVNPFTRLCPVIHSSNSKDLKIENVTVMAGGGMALIVERNENVTLNGFKVTSTKDRLVATRADATHFIGCKGTIKLENCVLEHMLDDGINVHGAYVKVEKYLGNNEFLCEISHFQQWGLVFAEPGDKIALLSRETVLPFFETTVESVTVLNEQRFTMKVANLPAQLKEGPLSVENLSWYPDVVLKNNIFRQNRARGALITTKGKVLIEDNVFHAHMHGILIEGDNKKWYESGAVQDVTIRNNTFINVGYAGGAAYPLFAAPMLTPEQRVGEGHYHRNINFVNNTIKSFNGNLVHALSVTGLNISGNTIKFSKDFPANLNDPDIDLHYCDDVTIKNNTYKGFKAPASIARSADTTNVKIANNKGIK